jgi:asparagine synthase (glutamine-hydrolysing)
VNVCGILGVLDAQRPVGEAHFERMLATLGARGPDGSGTQRLRGGAVSLGHTRLKIIDLSDDAAQPMPNEDGSIWLTFNGEIYNHETLRGVLEREGHVFRSRSDSEVIVHAYEQWGDGCVSHLRGIFAFGLWDEGRRRLLLARDRLGVKPLYYAAAAGRIAFASQPRALVEDPRFERRLDPSALRDYLAYGYVPFDRAIFRGMRKLPAAHRLVWEDGRACVERYWELDPRPGIHDAEEALFAVRAQVEESVVTEMLSDVPIGLFLSGGVDSTCVATLAAESRRERLSAFTIGYDDDASDERHFARIAAAENGLHHREDMLDPEDFRALLGPVVEAYDEPFYGGSAFPTYRVAQLAREHETVVVLSGDGGDEVFAGYHHYDRYAQVRAVPRAKRLYWRARARLRRGPGAWQSTDPVAEYFALPDVGATDAHTRRGLLSEPARREIGDDALWLLRRFYRPDLPPVRAARFLDLHTSLCDHILCKVDRASMASGVEVRVPLLDQRLVELGFRIDEGLVYAGGERKSLFKRAVADWIPEPLRTTRKKGFGIPVDAWAERALGGAAQRLVGEGSLVSRGALDREGARAFLDAPSRRRWLLVAAELWARRWLEGQPAADVVGELTS